MSYWEFLNLPIYK